MYIDRTHRGWVIALVILALGTGIYTGWLGAPGAGSRPGLVLGVGGAGLAVFCGLLPVRKKLLRVRRCAKWAVLRTAAWEKGHLYLGLFGCLLLHLHCGFRMGGPLTAALLTVLWTIILSGLLGLLFRHLLPLAKAAKDGKALLAARIITAGHQASLCCHVPLTVTLFSLAAVHAVMALFY
jgi:hypothetical protein